MANLSKDWVQWQVFQEWNSDWRCFKTKKAGKWNSASFTFTSLKWEPKVRKNTEKCCLEGGRLIWDLWLMVLCMFMHFQLPERVFFKSVSHSEVYKVLLSPVSHSNSGSVADTAMSTVVLVARVWISFGWDILGVQLHVCFEKKRERDNKKQFWENNILSNIQWETENICLCICFQGLSKPYFFLTFFWRRSSSLRSSSYPLIILQSSGLHLEFVLSFVWNVFENV